MAAAVGNICTSTRIAHALAAKNSTSLVFGDVVRFAVASTITETIDTSVFGHFGFPFDFAGFCWGTAKASING